MEFIANVQGLMAVAIGIIVGLGALGACPRHRHHGLEVPRIRRPPAGTRPDAPGPHVPARRPDRRGVPDRRRRGDDVRVRQPAARRSCSRADQRRAGMRPRRRCNGCRGIVPRHQRFAGHEIDPTYTTLLGQMFKFAILIWFTVKFIWPPMMKAIEDRQQKIAEGLAAADRSQKDLAQAQDKVNEELEEGTHAGQRDHRPGPRARQPDRRPGEERRDRRSQPPEGAGRLGDLRRRQPREGKTCASRCPRSPSPARKSCSSAKSTPVPTRR